MLDALSKAKNRQDWSPINTFIDHFMRIFDYKYFVSGIPHSRIFLNI